MVIYTLRLYLLYGHTKMSPMGVGAKVLAHIFFENVGIMLLSRACGSVTLIRPSGLWR